MKDKKKAIANHYKLKAIANRLTPSPLIFLYKGYAHDSKELGWGGSFRST